MDSFNDAMISSMPEARVLVCLVRISCANRSISGLRVGVSSSAPSGTLQTPIMDAS